MLIAVSSSEIALLASLVLVLLAVPVAIAYLRPAGKELRGAVDRLAGGRRHQPGEREASDELPEPPTYHTSDKAQACAELKDISDVVVSCPHAFFWAGEHITLYGAISAAQPISRRLWVGVKKVDLDEPPPGLRRLDDADVLSYWDPGRAGFMRSSWERAPEFARANRALLDRALDKMARILIPQGALRENEGVVFRALSEVPIGAGANWSGAFSAALAVAVLLLFDRESADQVRAWEHTALQELPDNPTFDRCMRAALAVEAALHGGRASGYGPLCALAGGGAPILYRTEFHVDPTAASDYPDALTTTIDPEFREIDRMRYDACRLNEKFGLPANSMVPGVEVAVVYTGDRQSPHEIKSRTHLHTHESGGIVRPTVARLDELVGLNRFQDDRLNDALAFNWAAPDGPFPPGTGAAMRVLASNSLDVLRILDSLYESHEASVEPAETDATIRPLFEAMKRTEASLELLQIDWHKGRVATGVLYDIASRQFQYADTAVKMTGSGRGGSLVLAMPSEPEGYADAVVRQLEQQRELLGPEASVIWFSGDERLGVRGATLE